MKEQKTLTFTGDEFMHFLGDALFDYHNIEGPARWMIGTNTITGKVEEVHVIYEQ